MSYGFALRRNLHDTVALSLTLEEGAEGTEAEEETLGPFYLRRRDPRWLQVHLHHDSC